MTCNGRSWPDAGQCIYLTFTAAKGCQSAQSHPRDRLRTNLGRTATMDFDQAHRAIKKGDVIAIRQAIRNGLSPNLSNRYSWSLLMLAALEGNTTIAGLLIRHGASIHAVNDFGETALSLAADASVAARSLVRAVSLSGVERDCGCAV
jgi:ankyrin repeat protein